MKFYLLSILFIIIISCNSKNDKRKNPIEKTNATKIIRNNRIIKSNNLETEISDFIKENPKKFNNIEVYYITFCKKNEDTIVTFQKGLYTDVFAFINQDVEYKGWLEFNGNFVNFVDRKINPIGKKLLDYKLLSRSRIRNKRVVEYHGQKRLHQLFIDKQFILREGILKVINPKELICVYH